MTRHAGNEQRGIIRRNMPYIGIVLVGSLSMGYCSYEGDLSLESRNAAAIAQGTQTPTAPTETQPTATMAPTPTDIPTVSATPTSTTTPETLACQVGASTVVDLGTYQKAPKGVQADTYVYGKAKVQMLRKDLDKARIHTVLMPVNFKQDKADVTVPLNMYKQFEATPETTLLGLEPIGKFVAETQIKPAVSVSIDRKAVVTDVRNLYKDLRKQGLMGVFSAASFASGSSKPVATPAVATATPKPTAPAPTVSPTAQLNAISPKLTISEEASQGTMMQVYLEAGAKDLTEKLSYATQLPAEIKERMTIVISKDATQGINGTAIDTLKSLQAESVRAVIGGFVLNGSGVDTTELESMAKARQIETIDGVTVRFDVPNQAAAGTLLSKTVEYMGANVPQPVFARSGYADICKPKG